MPLCNGNPCLICTLFLFWKISTHFQDYFDLVSLKIRNDPTNECEIVNGPANEWKTGHDLAKEGKIGNSLGDAGEIEIIQLANDGGYECGQWIPLR